MHIVKCSNGVEERKKKGISQRKILGERERELVKVRAQSLTYILKIFVKLSDHEIWLFIASKDTWVRDKVSLAREGDAKRGPFHTKLKPQRVNSE